MIDLDRIDFEKGAGLVTVVCQDSLSGAVLMVAHANRESLERTIATGEMHYWSRSRGLWHKGATSGNVQRVLELRQDCDADAILARVEPAGPACHTGSDSCFGARGQVAGVLARLDSVIRGRALGSPSDDSSAGNIESLRSGPPVVGDNRNRGEDRHLSSASGIEIAHTESPVVGDNPNPGNAPHHSSAKDTKTARTESPMAGDNTEQPIGQHPIPAFDSGESRSYTRQLLSDRNLRLKKIGEEAAELVTACADGDCERATEEAADLLYHTLVALRATGAGLRDVERVLANRESRRAAARS